MLGTPPPPPPSRSRVINTLAGCRHALIISCTTLRLERPAKQWCRGRRQGWAAARRAGAVSCWQELRALSAVPSGADPLAAKCTSRGTQVSCDDRTASADDGSCAAVLGVCCDMGEQEMNDLCTPLAIVTFLVPWALIMDKFSFVEKKKPCVNDLTVASNLCAQHGGGRVHQRVQPARQRAGRHRERAGRTIQGCACTTSSDLPRHFSVVNFPAITSMTEPLIGRFWVRVWVG